MDEGKVLWQQRGEEYQDNMAANRQNLAALEMMDTKVIQLLEYMIHPPLHPEPKIRVLWCY